MSRQRADSLAGWLTVSVVVAPLVGRFIREGGRDR